MLNISFLACTKVELWDLIVCIALNGEKFQSGAVTLTLVWQCPISNLFEMFHILQCIPISCSYIDYFFELSCKNTEIQNHGNTHTHRSDE